MKSSKTLNPFWRTLSTPVFIAPRSPAFTISRRLSILAANNHHQLRNRGASPLLSKRWTATTTPLASQHARSIATDPSAVPYSPVQGGASVISDPDTPKREEQPAYEITFTCKPCQTRSTHKISKQGYHKGTILISCPSCKNRHLICDHLKIFRDKSTTIEDIVKERGESVKYGSLGAEGDIEIWDDGTTTERATNKSTSGVRSTPVLESNINPANP